MSAEPQTPTGKRLVELGVHSLSGTLAIEAEAIAIGAKNERLRLSRLYAADALALGWTRDMLAAILRRLAEPEE